MLSFKKIAFVLVLAAVASAHPSKDREDEIDLSHLGENIFGYPDESNGDNLRFLTPENITGNPEELGNYAEGDILFVNSDLRNGVRSPAKRWPNAVVPYTIAGSFSKNTIELLFNFVIKMVKEFNNFPSNYFHSPAGPSDH